jgi:mediator of RNA polymerase II transcription subunit 12
MIDIEVVEINLLQAILVVGDATAREGKTASSKSKPEQSQQMHLSSTSGGSNKTPISGSSGGELSISHILGTSDILGSGDDPLLDLG